MATKQYEILTCTFEDGLTIIYTNLVKDISCVLYLSPEQLLRSLFISGYIHDFDKQLVLVPLPSDEPDNTLYHWVSLSEFMEYECTLEMGEALVIDYHRYKEQIDSKWSAPISRFK